LEPEVSLEEGLKSTIRYFEGILDSENMDEKLTVN